MVYSFSRLLGLLTRPLSLIIVKFFLDTQLSTQLAQTYIYITLALAFLSFDAHVPFYKSLLNVKRNKNTKRYFKKYLRLLILQFFIFIPIFLIFIFYSFRSYTITIAFIFYLISEVIYDESQRFLIFTSKYSEWGLAMISRFTLQSGILLLSAKLFPDIGIAGIIIIFSLTNIVSYYKYLPIKYLKVIIKNLTFPIATLLDFKSLWLVALLSTFLLYSDRILSSIFKPEILAGYFVLVSSFSLVQAFVNFFYLSYKRGSIVSGTISFNTLISSKKLLFVVASSSLISIPFSVVSYILFFNSINGYLALAPIVYISQLSFSITSIAREYFYWHLPIKYLVFLEALIVFSIIILFIGIKLLDINFQFSLILVLALNLSRLLFITILNYRMPSNNLV